jgi:ABC-type Co2+ transport system permease subunit
MYRWIVFLHIAGIFGFLLAHGSSAGVAFALRRERRPERLRALLDLSSSTLSVFYLSLLVLLAAGIVAGFMGHWWGQGWIWLSLGVLVAMVVGCGSSAASTITGCGRPWAWDTWKA